MLALLTFQQFTGQSIKSAKIDSTGRIEALFVFENSEVTILLEKKVVDRWLVLDSLHYSLVYIEPSSKATASNLQTEINYDVTVPLDTGINIYKISTKNQTEFLETYSDKKRNFENYINKNFINFTEKTDYSLRNVDGVYLESGNVPFINIKRLPKGKYYLIIDRKKIIEFVK